MRSEWVIRYRGDSRRTVLLISRGGLERLGRFTRHTTSAARALVVADARVAALYGDCALRSLRRAGIDASLVSVPAGERTKRTAMLDRLWKHLAAAALDRSGVVVALGGGVTLDLAGLSAATWLRGVDWIGVPTSLLAQVDASVGGKTAIDLPAGKNLVGAFHQPAGVLIDPDTLATLPDRHVRAGLAEVIKCGMVVDAGLFRWLERSIERLSARDPRALDEAVLRAVRVKARVVSADERERAGGGRTALNFGHTVGHAIEAALGYRRLLHGEAVAIGMRVAARLSSEVGGLAAKDRARLDHLLDRASLPARMPGLALDRLLNAMARDKKRRFGATCWVLTPRVGHASVPRLIPGRLVRAALLDAGARA